MTKNKKCISYNMDKFLKIRNAMSPEDMFVMYNAVNFIVNGKYYDKEQMHPYTKLAKKVRGMLTK